MAKKDMTHPDVTRGPRNDVSPVPQIQGKAKSGKEKANPIIAGTTGANQKVWHEKPISKAHGIIDTDLASPAGCTLLSLAQIFHDPSHMVLILFHETSSCLDGFIISHQNIILNFFVKNIDPQGLFKKMRIKTL